LKEPTPIDIGGDAEPLQQAGIIGWSARAGDQHGAERVEPHFIGMGGELVAVVAIAGGVGDDPLARAACPVEGGADVGQSGLAATGEDVEIEREGLDPVVAGGDVDRAHHLAQAIFARRRSAAQRLEGAALARLLDDGAREVEPQGAFAGAVAVRAGRKRCPDRAEEEEQRTARPSPRPIFSTLCRQTP
jgi:hypothetical protein